MRKIKAKLLSLIITACIITATFSIKANDETTTSQMRNETISALQKALKDHYIYLDKAKQVEKRLSELDHKNMSKAYSDDKEYAQAVTEIIQTIINDKHFRFVVPRSRNTSDSPREDLITRHLNALSRFRQGGFKDIRMLEGNVGYVKIDGFRGEEIPQVDGLMSYLRTADAIIIDLQKNGGGGQPVNYLSSYFLPKDTLIGKTYHRHKDKWVEHIVEPIKGDKRLDVPLYILTSERTFSAAEAFSYNLQALKRATIVGARTAGGAHPTRFMPLPNGFAVLMPDRRSYNPITQSNWEATGVQPDIETKPADALNKAHQLAKKAAKQYREKHFNTLRKLLASTEYSTQLQQQVTDTIKVILHRKHMQPFMVAGFAERYQEDGLNTAARLLTVANTQIFSENNKTTNLTTATP